MVVLEFNSLVRPATQKCRKLNVISLKRHSKQQTKVMDGVGRVASWFPSKLTLAPPSGAGRLSDSVLQDFNFVTVWIGDKGHFFAVGELFAPVLRPEVEGEVQFL